MGSRALLSLLHSSAFAHLPSRPCAGAQFDARSQLPSRCAQVHSLMIKKTSAVTTTVLGALRLLAAAVAGCSALRSAAQGRRTCRGGVARPAGCRPQRRSGGSGVQNQDQAVVGSSQCAMPLPGPSPAATRPALTPLPALSTLVFPHTPPCPLHPCVPSHPCLPAPPSATAGEVKIVGLLLLSAMLLGEGKEFTLKMTVG